MGLYCHVPSSHHITLGMTVLSTLALEDSLERCSWHSLQWPNQVRWESGSVVGCMKLRVKDVRNLGTQE